MNRIKNALIVLAGLSALSIFVAVLTPRSIQGQGGGANKVKVDEAIREPVTISLGSFQVAGQETFATETFLVPEGKRLVVEHLYGSVVGSGDLPQFWLRTVVPGQGSALSLPLSYTTTAWPGAGDTFNFCFTQPVKAYVANPTDDGKAWGIDVFAADHGNGRVVFSGYLEPLP
ncbi:MAG TPA: hypothetical protein VFM63_03305 [Pyrinomonadaceae bacterium]|nr:hypothetical protein [Pyrinomonadaceae bacterium]